MKGIVRSLEKILFIKKRFSGQAGMGRHSFFFGRKCYCYSQVFLSQSSF